MIEIGDNLAKTIGFITALYTAVEFARAYFEFEKERYTYDRWLDRNITNTMEEELRKIEEGMRE